jgi:hypothetical protein
VAWSFEKVTLPQKRQQCLTVAFLKCSMCLFKRLYNSLALLVLPQILKRFAVANQFFKRAFRHNPALIKDVDIIELRQQVQAVD